MRARYGIAIVCILTLFVLFVIALAGSRGDPEEECSSCHGAERTEGRYVYEAPKLRIVVPENVTAGDTFQVLVFLTDPPEYEIISPRARIGYEVASGTGGDHTDLERNGTTWTGVLRVRGDALGGNATVNVDYSVHHDHSGSVYPDIASYSLEERIIIGWWDPKVEEGTNDSPLGIALLIAGPASLSGWIICGRKRL